MISLIFGVVAVRLMLPGMIRNYVNITLDQSILYEGKIGDIDVNIWRGAYSINDVRILKRTGNTAVPFFAAKRVDFSVEWDALWKRRLVGRMTMEQPQLNFVDSNQQSEVQTGAGGPWLKLARDLFPFKINSAKINDGSIHFRAFKREPPVDVYLSKVDATVENLSNISNELTPLLATAKIKALAMDQAKFEMQLKLDPNAYFPTFQMALRLVGLDVTKTNSLTQSYGQFDFESGNFDLVIELNSQAGQLEGYVKPLFRHIVVLGRQDLEDKNVGQVFWEALVGITAGILKNQSRDQFATVIPVSGDLTSPDTDFLASVGNVLHNAFVRAYLPRLEQGQTSEINSLEFGRGSVIEPTASGNDEAN